MNTQYRAKINEVLEVQISNEDLQALDSIKIAPFKYHILQENTSYTAEISAGNFNDKIYTVTINNSSYQVKINDDLDVLIQDLGFKQSQAKRIDRVTAPMPGLILEINIKSGDRVQENAPLLILEAMKMENIISAPTDGTIKSINVKKGDAVNKNQLLIEFE